MEKVVMSELQISVIVATLWECPASIIGDAGHLEQVCRRACREANLQLLHFYAHRFEPCGLTAMAVLGESHIALHSWPEAGALFVDVSTCSGSVATARAFEYICSQVPHGYVDRRDIALGDQQATP